MTQARTFPGGPTHAVEWDDVSTGITLCGTSVYSYDIRTTAPVTCVVCLLVLEQVVPLEEDIALPGGTAVLAPADGIVTIPESVDTDD